MWRQRQERSKEGQCISHLHLVSIFRCQRRSLAKPSIWWLLTSSKRSLPAILSSGNYSRSRSPTVLHQVQTSWQNFTSFAMCTSAMGVDFRLNYTNYLRTLDVSINIPWQHRVSTIRNISSWLNQLDSSLGRLCYKECLLSTIRVLSDVPCIQGYDPNRLSPAHRV